MTFRSAIITILRETGRFSPWPSNIISSLLFSLSHAHAAIVSLIKGQRSDDDALDVAIQCGFTFIFGLYAGHLFIRSSNLFIFYSHLYVLGSLWTVVVVHSLCNAVGFPDLNLAMRLPGPLLLGLGLGGGVSLSLAFALLRLL